MTCTGGQLPLAAAIVCGVPYRSIRVRVMFLAPPSHASPTSQALPAPPFAPWRRCSWPAQGRALPASQAPPPAPRPPRPLRAVAALFLACAGSRLACFAFASPASRRGRAVLGLRQVTPPLLRVRLAASRRGRAVPGRRQVAPRLLRRPGCLLQVAPRRFEASRLRSQRSLALLTSGTSLRRFVPRGSASELGRERCFRPPAASTLATGAPHRLCNDQRASCVAR